MYILTLRHTLVYPTHPCTLYTSQLLQLYHHREMYNYGLEAEMTHGIAYYFCHTSIMPPMERRKVKQKQTNNTTSPGSSVLLEREGDWEKLLRDLFCPHYWDSWGEK